MKHNAMNDQSFEMTFFESIKNYGKKLAHKDSSELLTMATEVVKHVADAVEKPSPINLVKCAFNVWKTIDSNKTYAEDFFHPDWSYPYSRQFNDFIVDAISSFPYKVISAADDDNLVKIANVYGEEVGWVYSTSDKSASSVYVRNTRHAEACAAIKKALWEKMAFRSIVMEKLPPKGGNSYSDAVNFKKDDDLVGLQSAKADEYSQYLQRCMDAGVPRTILFYGRPGTGKSTISRAISDKLNLKTLRIRVEDIGEFDNSVIFEAVSVFEPDAVILDDLDRAMSQSHLLETMDRFHKHIKLVFATVNQRDALDEALMRPGRFDEVCHIKRLDDIVIKKLLGDENMDMFETVKDWPIAFIQEYVTRRRFMEKDEAMNSVRELQKRVERLSTDDDEEYDPEDQDFDADSADDSFGLGEDDEVIDNVMGVPGTPVPETIKIPDNVRRLVKGIKIVRNKNFVLRKKE